MKLFFTLLLTSIIICNNLFSKTNLKNKSIQSYQDRSDSIDILHTEIYLKITDFASKFIEGKTILTFTPKINQIYSINLDLLKLTIDSIFIDGQYTTYKYNDTLLKVNLLQPASINDTLLIEVQYSGIPQKDSKWGGNYFTSDIFFNLGVGFKANPHNYGRALFPCFDNFIERSTYNFKIETSSVNNAVCNGTLIDIKNLTNNNKLYEWSIEESIPSYLVGIAIGPYYKVKSTHNGIQKNIPIELYSLHTDTNNLKSSFFHLNDAISIFENAYGPYSFNKVGYVIIPFQRGAMEHATNIAYPKYAIDGTLKKETLMAHELSHHWWGNLATCETPEDMWLNEGWATFSEFLFLEKVYGRNRYLEEVKKMHYFVLTVIHKDEKGFRAVSGIPHEYTYGNHVYRKGALVAHNMRGYLNDVDFFNGISSFLEQRKFNTMNSNEFKSFMTINTNGNMSQFFDNWVFSGGWNDFELDSFHIQQILTNKYEISLFIQQKLFGRNEFHKNVPLEIGFYKQDFTFETHKVPINDEFTEVKVILDFKPVWITINPNHNLVYATTDFFDTIKTSTTTIKDYSDMTVKIIKNSNPSLLRIEHHRTSPDPIYNTNKNHYRLSTHYWQVDGILNNDFFATAEITYDGRSSSYQNYDSTLVKFTEDSLVLLYRSDASNDWTEYDNYTKNILGSTNDKYGKIEIHELKKGQYSFANIDHSVLIKSITKKKDEIKFYPNPTHDIINFDFYNNENLKNLIIFDIHQKQIKNINIKGKTSINIDVSSFKKGVYIFSISNKNHEPYYDGKFIVY